MIDLLRSKAENETLACAGNPSRSAAQRFGLRTTESRPSVAFRTSVVSTQLARVRLCIGSTGDVATGCLEAAVGWSGGGRRIVDQAHCRLGIRGQRPDPPRFRIRASSDAVSATAGLAMAPIEYRRIELTQTDSYWLIASLKFRSDLRRGAIRCAVKERVDAFRVQRAWPIIG
jgi:hypothetical protein